MEIISDPKVIERQCIIDHLNYLKSYVKHQKKRIANNYTEGIERRNQIEKTVNDIAIHYPRVMSLLLCVLLLISEESARIYSGCQCWNIIAKIIKRSSWAFCQVYRVFAEGILGFNLSAVLFCKYWMILSFTSCRLSWVWMVWQPCQMNHTPMMFTVLFIFTCPPESWCSMEAAAATIQCSLCL